MRRRVVLAAFLLCVATMACLGDWLIYEIEGVRVLAAYEAGSILVGEEPKEYRCQQLPITACSNPFNNCGGANIGQCTTNPSYTCYRCSITDANYRACVEFGYDLNCIPDHDNTTEPCGSRSQSSCTWVVNIGCRCRALLPDQGGWPPFDPETPCDQHCTDDQ